MGRKKGRLRRRNSTIFNSIVWEGDHRSFSSLVFLFFFLLVQKQRSSRGKEGCKTMEISLIRFHGLTPSSHKKKSDKKGTGGTEEKIKGRCGKPEEAPIKRRKISQSPPLNHRSSSSSKCALSWRRLRRKKHTPAQPSQQFFSFFPSSPT